MKLVKVRLSSLVAGQTFRSIDDLKAPIHKIEQVISLGLVGFSMENITYNPNSRTPCYAAEYVWIEE